MSTETFEFWALQAFVCYNEYGERDDLTDEETAQWDEYVASLPSDKRRPPNHVSAESDAYDEFRRCDVTGVMGACNKFTAVWLGP